jgi:hypothetical protein
VAGGIEVPVLSQQQDRIETVVEPILLTAQ